MLKGWLVYKQLSSCCILSLYSNVLWPFTTCIIGHMVTGGPPSSTTAKAQGLGHPRGMAGDWEWRQSKRLPYKFLATYYISVACYWWLVMRCPAIVPVGVVATKYLSRFTFDFTSKSSTNSSSAYKSPVWLWFFFKKPRTNPIDWCHSRNITRLVSQVLEDFLGWKQNHKKAM